MIRKSRNNLLIITTILLCSINSVYGQEKNTEEVELNKNAVYGKAGIGPLYLTGTGFYERMVTQNLKISSFVKGGVGGFFLLLAIPIYSRYAQNKKMPSA